MRLNERLKRLEKKQPTKTVYAWRWGHEDSVTVEGERMTLQEYERRYPNATVIHMTWGDDEPAAEQWP